MFKRSVFTNISPLPPNVTRETAIEFLHDHLEMIDLNPLIKERHIIEPPAYAESEERRCVWYSLTDKISYLPGGVMSGDVTYTCAFHDLPLGIQTHCYAPMGLDIRDKWTVGGTVPGEAPEPVELGIGAPTTGLYIREDVEMKCNIIMTSFVKKTLQKSHAVLVDRLASKASLASSRRPSPPAPTLSVNHHPQHAHQNSWQSSHSHSNPHSRSSSHSRSHSQTHSRSQSHSRNYSGSHPDPYEGHHVNAALSAHLGANHSHSRSSSHSRHPSGASADMSGQANAPGPFQHSSASANHYGAATQAQHSWSSPPPPPPPPKDGQPHHLLAAQQYGNSNDGPARSDTIYRGPSKPQDYAQLSGLNPYGEGVPQVPPMPDTANEYRPRTGHGPQPQSHPLHVPQNQLAAELE